MIDPVDTPETDNIYDALLGEGSDTKAESEPWQDFKIGFLAGVLFAFVGFSLSLEMTHTAVSEASAMQWVGAIALPFILGILAAIFKEPFLKLVVASTSVLPY